MNNNRIYSEFELKTTGILEEETYKRYKPNDFCSLMRADVLESIYHYNEKDVNNGVSLFLRGGGNIILGDVSLSKFLKLMNDEKLYYKYSRKYEKWFIYSVE